MKILHLLDERWDSGLTAYALQSAGLQKDAGQSVTVGILTGKKPEQMAKERGLATAVIGTPSLLRRLLNADAWDVINVHTGSLHTWSVVFSHPLLKMVGLGTRRSAPIVRTRGDARELRTDWLTRRVYRRTAGVIAASEHIGHQYEEGFGLDENKLRVIYPSMIADPFLATPPNDIVGILGRLDPIKGHSVFLEAAALVRAQRPATRFLIAGAEANVTVELLRNQARVLDIESVVSFLGFQSSAREFMRGCSLGVIASLGSEEISRACLEWMSVGRPIVSTLVGCLSELIEPGENGLLVSAGDSKALADAILAALNDPERLSRWGKNSIERIRRRFNPERELSDTLSVYQNAIAGTSRKK